MKQPTSSDQRAVSTNQQASCAGIHPTTRPLACTHQHHQHPISLTQPAHPATYAPASCTSSCNRTPNTLGPTFPSCAKDLFNHLKVILCPPASTSRLQSPSIRSRCFPRSCGRKVRNGRSLHTESTSESASMLRLSKQMKMVESALDDMWRRTLGNFQLEASIQRPFCYLGRIRSFSVISPQQPANQNLELIASQLLTFFVYNSFCRRLLGPGLCIAIARFCWQAAFHYLLAIRENHQSKVLAASFEISSTSFPKWASPASHKLRREGTPKLVPYILALPPFALCLAHASSTPQLGGQMSSGA